MFYHRKIEFTENFSHCRTFEIHRGHWREKYSDRNIDKKIGLKPIFLFCDIFQMQSDLRVRE